MTDEQGPADSIGAPGDDAPLAAAAEEPAAPDATGAAAPRPPAVGGAVLAWSKLDQSAQLVAAGSIAAIVITLIGLPIGVWAATNFVLIMLAATIVTALTGWAGPSTAPGGTQAAFPVVELGGGAVAAVLAMWNLIETLADFEDPRGGIVGLLLAVALAIAAAAILVGAFRRNGGARGVMTGDMWTRLTLGGLALVLIGWALNLSVGYWVISAAALSLAALTIATVVIVLTRRIPSPIPAAWLGVVLGVFAAFLALGLWGDLAELGDTKVDLSIIDILAFLIYVVGILAIIAGGVLTALEQGAKTVAPDAPPPAPS